jgi:hypothetical protein
MAKTREEAIEELLKFNNDKYDKDTDTLDKIKNILERIREGKEKHSSEYVGNLLNQKTNIEESISLQNDRITRFLDEMSAKYNADDLDTNMLQDLLKYREAYSTLANKIDELNAILAERQADPNANPAEIARIKKAIDENETRQIDERVKLQVKYGVHSIADLEAEAFESNPDAVKEVYEYYKKIKELQTELTRKELRELKEAERRFQEAEKKAQEKRNTILNAIKAGVNGIITQVKSGGDLWMKYNAQAIADAKRLGMTSKESARAYMDTMMESSKELSRNFALTAEQAMKMQETFTKVTGRSVVLTLNQMEDITAASKLMGDEVVSSTIEAMDNMGASSQTAAELLDKNYARAVNNGLDVVKTSEAFAKNLSLANKLTFKNGVDGISKMTILSQKLRMNLQEVANVAEKFSTIEGAIEGSAQLQMLGGAGAMYGGNPMQMLYESLSDPEALFKRMTDVFAEQARFDRRTGESVIAPLQQAIIKEQAKALGMSSDEAIQSAKQQARVRDIEASVPWLLNQYGRNSEEMSTIANKAQYNKEKQAWEVSYFTKEGEKKTVGVNSEDLTPDVMADIMKDSIEPVEDIRLRVREIASNLIGTKERKDSMVDQWKTGISQLINGVMWKFDSLLTWLNKSGLWKWIVGGGVGTAAGLLGYGAYKGVGSFMHYTFAKWERNYIKDGKMPFRNGNGTTPVPATPNNGHSPTPNNPNPTPTQPGNPNNPTPTPNNAPRAKGKWWKNAINKRNMASVAGKTLTTAAMVYEVYSLGKELEATNKNYDDRIKEAKTYATTRERAEKIRQAAKDRNEDAGKSVGSTIGGIGGALAGAAIGTAIGGPVGTVVGFAAGALLGVAGDKIGGNVGKSLGGIMGGGSNDEAVVTYLESIDDNVNTIVRGRGLAQNNINPTFDVEYDAVQDGNFVHNYVNPTPSNDSYQPRNVSGNLALNVGGTINLNLGGNNVSQVTAQEISKMIASNQQLRNEIVTLVTKTQLSNVNAGRNEGETARAMRGTPVGIV